METFPVDDVTLAILEAAIEGDGERSHLFDVLEVPEDTAHPCTCVVYDGIVDTTECKRHLSPWHPHEVIYALIHEVRRLREA